jgi:molybdopterin-synthase adenylyltransferase
MSGPLTDEQLLRYSRQIVLAEIDYAGQERLAAARVLVLGLGGLGSPVALYLAGAGIGQIELADPDRVDLSNLHRQIIHRTDGVGLTKTSSARQALLALNPDVQVTTHDTRLAGPALREAVRRADVVVDATDNFASRFEINRACVETRTPLAYGAVIGLEGQSSLFRCDLDDSPCYACLHPDLEGRPEAETPEPGWENCSGQGVLGPVAGLVGCIQATETLKLLLGVGQGLVGRLLTIDARDMQFQCFELPKDPRCPACGRRTA